MDYIQLVEIIGTAIAVGWITRILTIRARVRKEGADAQKAEAEADSDQIENIRKTMDQVYKPIIEDLKLQVREVKDEVSEVRAENARLKDEVSEVRAENARLKEENTQLRSAIRKISPKAITSRRGINAKGQPRDNGGRFAKAKKNEKV